MLYDFLKDFHRRAEIIAIVNFVTSRVSRKIKLKDCEIETGEAVNLIMLVLCFIMEKSLVEEPCTKNDIASFLRRVEGDYPKKNIGDEEYISLTDYLIKDCLQNSGIPHYFSTYNFETKKEEKINVKLIDDKRILQGSDAVYSYYMTPQGYKFMFNTLEIEDAMKVSIEQFKLSLSIKKRNFSAARNNVDSLFNISKTQIQRIHYFIKRVKEDIGSAGIEEYEKIYNSTFSAIDEQKEGYGNLYQLIEKVERSIMESSEGKIEKEALDKEFENIVYIKNRLKFIINEQTTLLLKQQELQKIYNEAVDNILFIGFESRWNFDEMVVKRFEENPQVAYPLIKILRPLFMPDIERMLNIKMALKDQKLTSSESNDESNGIFMNRACFGVTESESEIKIRDLNEKYADIFETLLKGAMEAPNKEILLSRILVNAKEGYGKLVPDLKILTNVLLQLYNAQHVDFYEIKNQQRKTVFNPSEEFDIKYCVLALLHKGEEYKKIKSMKVLVSRNETVFIPEKEMENDHGIFIKEQVTGLRCPDMLFKIEVEKE